MAPTRAVRARRREAIVPVASDSLARVNWRKRMAQSPSSSCASATLCPTSASVR